MSATETSGHRPRLLPVLWFLLLAVAFSWGLWLPMIASQRGWIGVKIPVMPWGSFGPALAALAMSLRGGAGRLLRPAVRFRARGVDYAIAVLAPVVALAVAVAAEFAARGSIPELANLDKLWMAPLLWIVIMIVGGPLGEEIGWRGYALPRLLEVLSPAAASVAIGAMWLVWHLPLFWLEGSAQQGGSIAGFALAVFGFAIVFTWFWTRTGGNVWMAILLHTSINTSAYGLPMIVPSIESETVLTPVFNAIVCLAALAIVLAWRRRRMEPDGEAASTKTLRA